MTENAPISGFVHSRCSAQVFLGGPLRLCLKLVSGSLGRASRTTLPLF
jgi:hypothetical protein